MVQRTRRAPLFGAARGALSVLEHQLFIVFAASGYIMGVTQSREYAEPEWYVDSVADDSLDRLPGYHGRHDVRRKEPHIYVALWYYMAFILTIAVLHIVNNSGSRFHSSVRRATLPLPACRTP